ncbi:MAG TPA: hypothetical protein VJL87_00150, partial [Bdellovibrionota bacterium]|nr:hypothetical protein [Bdellovibrionota bacterium]
MLYFDQAMKALVDDIILHCAYFQHIKLDKVLISTKPSKVPGSEGLWAQLFPMRYKNGAFSGVEREGSRLERYKMEPLVIDGKEIFYIIYFFAPRFHQIPFIEKMTTIFHELYHISPEFNGDVRRFPGKNYMHGTSMEKYDSLMMALAKDYLFRTQNLEKSDFLRFGYRALQKRYGVVLESQFPEPFPLYVGSVQ